MAAKHTGKTKLSVPESRKMIQKMEKDEYEDIVKTVIENVETRQDLEIYQDRNTELLK